MQGKHLQLPGRSDIFALHFSGKPMFANIKRLTKHSAIYGIGHILSRGLGFLLLPIYTNYLEPAQYGLYALAFSYFVIVNILYFHGLDSAFLRFFIHREDDAGRLPAETVFSTSFYSLMATGLLLTITGLVFARPVAEMLFHTPELTVIIRYCHLILLLDTAAIIPFLTLRAHEQSVRFGLLKVLNIAVLLVLNIYFIIFRGQGIEGIFLANLLASGFTLLTLLPVLLTSLRLSFSAMLWRGLIRFALPYLPTTLSVVLMDVIDRFILEHFTDEATVGVYSAGYRLAMVMALFVAAFRFAWHPFFLATAREQEARKLFARILTYYILACMVLYLSMAWFVDDLVRIRFGSGYLFGEEYWAGTGVVPILMLAYILFGVYANFLVGIHLSKKTWLLAGISVLGALTNIIGNMVFIPWGGMYAAAWVTVVSYAVMTGALYAVAHRLYPVPYEFSRLAVLIAVTAALFILAQVFELAFFGKIVLLFSLPIVLYFLKFFKEDERAALRHMLGL